MENNNKTNGFLKYIMSGIFLVLILGSFAWTTLIYMNLTTKLDNHLVHMSNQLNTICDRLGKIEGKLNIP